MALNKGQIFQLDDIKRKEIEVPVWDGTVYIRQLTRGQQDQYHRRRFKSSNIKHIGGTPETESSLELFGHDAWLVAQGVCDEDGGRLFSNSDVKDLEKKNGEAIGFIAAEIVKFSGMAKDVEELEEAKN